MSFKIHLKRWWKRRRRARRLEQARRRINDRFRFLRFAVSYLPKAWEPAVERFQRAHDRLTRLETSWKRQSPN